MVAEGDVGLEAVRVSDRVSDLGAETSERHPRELQALGNGERNVDLIPHLAVGERR